MLRRSWFFLLRSWPLDPVVSGPFFWELRLPNCAVSPQKLVFPYRHLYLNLEGTRSLFDHSLLHSVPHVLCPCFSGRLICTWRQEWVMIMTDATMNEGNGRKYRGAASKRPRCSQPLTRLTHLIFYKTLQAKYCSVLHCTKGETEHRDSVSCLRTQLVSGGTRLHTRQSAAKSVLLITTGCASG